MKAMLIRTATGLSGATPEDHQAWIKFKERTAAMKQGQYVHVEWRLPRNGKHHRKLFALIQLIVKNSEIYQTPKQALVAIKLAAGYFEPHINPVSHALEMVPHSISFDEMEQEDFNKFYDAAIHGICTSILPQFDKATCQFLLEKIINGWASRVPDFGNLV